MPAIECRGLTYLYDSGQENSMAVKALDNVNVEIEPGQFVAILGGNGSGKSTLAKHFNALLMPSEGKCLVNGIDTSEQDNIWQVRTRCGMVFQNPDNQIVAAIVEEDVAFGPENLGIASSAIHDRVYAALDTVNMTEYSKHSPHLLSGGQKQRIAIAGALAMDPDILVLDEPTAMLDPTGRQEVMDTLLQLKKSGAKTVILITHFMEEAVLADRILVMKEGRLVLDGPPHEVFCEIKLLDECGLEVPLAADMAEGFRAAGIDVPPHVITNSEFLESICR